MASKRSATDAFAETDTEYQSSYPNPQESSGYVAAGTLPPSTPKLPVLGVFTPPIAHQSNRQKQTAPNIPSAPASRALTTKKGIGGRGRKPGSQAKTSARKAPSKIGNVDDLQVDEASSTPAPTKAQRRSTARRESTVEISDDEAQLSAHFQPRLTPEKQSRDSAFTRPTVPNRPRSIIVQNELKKRKREDNLVKDNTRLKKVNTGLTTMNTALVEKNNILTDRHNAMTKLCQENVIALPTEFIADEPTPNKPMRLTAALAKSKADAMLKELAEQKEQIKIYQDATFELARAERSYMETIKSFIEFFNELEKSNLFDEVADKFAALRAKYHEVSGRHMEDEGYYSPRVPPTRVEGAPGVPAGVIPLTTAVRRPGPIVQPDWRLIGEDGNEEETSNKENQIASAYAKVGIPLETIEQPAALESAIAFTQQLTYAAGGDFGGLPTAPTMTQRINSGADFCKRVPSNMLASDPTWGTDGHYSSPTEPFESAAPVDRRVTAVLTQSQWTNVDAHRLIDPALFEYTDTDDGTGGDHLPLAPSMHAQSENQVDQFQQAPSGYRPASPVGAAIPVYEDNDIDGHDYATVPSASNPYTGHAAPTQSFSDTDDYRYDPSSNGIALPETNIRGRYSPDDLFNSTNGLTTTSITGFGSANNYGNYNSDYTTTAAALATQPANLVPSTGYTPALTPPFNPITYKPAATATATPDENSHELLNDTILDTYINDNGFRGVSPPEPEPLAPSMHGYGQGYDLSWDTMDRMQSYEEGLLMNGGAGANGGAGRVPLATPVGGYTEGYGL